MDVRSALARCALAGLLMTAAHADASPYARLIVVAESGGDFGSGQLLEALASITDASAESRYLVKLQPGTYHVTSTLAGKPYVDIEGSGEGVTVVEGVGVKVFTLAANQEVRSLTFKESTATRLPCLVEALGAGTMRNVTIDGNDRQWHTTGLSVRASARFDHVTVRVAMASWTWGATAVGVDAGAPVFEHCTFLADAKTAAGTGFGTGFAVGQATTPGLAITVNDSTIYGSRTGLAVTGCSFCTVGDMWVRNSAISADPGGYTALLADYANVAARLYVWNSTISGSVNVLNPYVKCVGTYTPALVPVTCP